MNTTIELMQLRDQAAREIAAATDHQEYCRAHGVLNIVLAAVKKFPIPTEENLNALKWDIQQFHRLAALHYRLRVLVLDTLRTWSTAHSLDLGDDIENRVAVAVNADMIPDLKYTLCWINQLSVFKTTTTYEVDNTEVASVTVQCGLTYPPLTITLGVF